MSLELKKVLEYLGFDPETVNTEDAFRSEFDKAFVKGSAIAADSPFVKPILGRVFGEQENELKKIAKAMELDVDFESDDFKNNHKITEKAKYLIGKLDEKKQASIKELQTKLASGSDENLKDLQSKLEKLKKDKADVQGLLDHTKTEFETFKTQSANELKGVKVSVLKKDVYSQVKFRPDASDIEKKGFDAIINDQLNFDIDEDKLIVTDKSGQRLKSAKQAGEFKTPLEAITEIATANKLIQLNQDGGKPAPEPLKTNFGGQSGQGQGQQNPAAPARKVADRME